MASVSVVVPTLRGERHLPTCLDALRRQTRPPNEIVVVVDGSVDGTRALLARQYPDLAVVSHQATLGVARSFNDGIRATSGSIVVLLNDDTEAEPDWVARLCEPLEGDEPAGFAASKLRLFDRRDVLHSAGDYFGRDGMPGSRGVWEVDRGQLDQSTETFGACAAAAAYHRSMLNEVGLFDETLGSYCEDVDLSFRARLLGHECRFAASALVYHRLSATGGGTTASYFVGRNVIWVVAQNLPGALLRKYWPRVVARQVAVALEALRHWREPAAQARLRGQLAGFRGLAERLGRRDAIQQRRRVSIAALDALLS
jgi:GT2 family glycosyltransferase